MKRSLLTPLFIALSLALSVSANLPAIAQTAQNAAQPAAAKADAAKAPATAAATSPVAVALPPQATMPAIAATAFLLIDLSTGSTLAANSETVQREPASLTKLMTAYLVFDALKQKQLTMEQTVPVSKAAWKAEGSRMFIEPTRPVNVSDLLRGLIIQSGNDAAIALAEAVAGSEDAFALRMNAQAKKLGMSQSSFANAAGLPAPGHLTTAHDMALLVGALIRDFPQYYPIYKEKSFTYNKITQENRNRLLFTDPSVDGVKTGHTQSAGYNLIASALRDGRRLLSIVMGTKSEKARAVESKKLLDYGFSAFDAALLKAKNSAIIAPQVWKGVGDTVELGVDDDWRVSIVRGAAVPTVSWQLDKPQLVAPLPVGTKVGVVRAKFGDKVVSERPLVVLQAVEEGNFFKRLWHSLRMKWA